MVVMARMSQNVLVTLRNSFFSRAPQYQMFSIGRMSVKFVNKDSIALSGATESFMVLVRDSMLAVALLAVPFWHNWQLMLMTVFLALKSSKAPTNYFTPNILRKSWSRLVVSVVHLDALAFPVAAT